MHEWQLLCVIIYTIEMLAFDAILHPLGLKTYRNSLKRRSCPQTQTQSLNTAFIMIILIMYMYKYKFMYGFMLVCTHCIFMTCTT